MDMPGESSSAGSRKSAESASTKKATRSPSAQKPLSVPLSETKDQAAFRYLFRETSLESIHRCLAKVRDQEIVEFLQNGIIQVAELMSSEAFNGLERTRRQLRALRPRVADDPAGARRHYDKYAESLGQLVFALGRRLGQFDEFLSGCPFSGSSESTRGLLGQCVRDLAGDVVFLRFELNLWVERCVPLRGELPNGVEGRAFLEGRISAIVDDLGTSVEGNSRSSKCRHTQTAHRIRRLTDPSKALQTRRREYPGYGSTLELGHRAHGSRQGLRRAETA